MTGNQQHISINTFEVFFSLLKGLGESRRTGVLIGEFTNLLIGKTGKGVRSILRPFERSVEGDFVNHIFLTKSQIPQFLKAFAVIILSFEQLQNLVVGHAWKIAF